MRSVVCVLVLSLAVGAGATASSPASAGAPVAAEAKQAGVPPGLAKKGGVPPGLAKRFGPSLPAKAYVAVDPRYDDRAWFLIDGRWVLQEGFDANVRLEVRSLAALPSAPPPVPLPKVAVGFHVVLFD